MLTFNIKVTHLDHPWDTRELSKKVKNYIKYTFISSYICRKTSRCILSFFFIRDPYVCPRRVTLGRKLHGKLRVRVPRVPILRTTCPRRTGRRGRNDTKIRVVGRNSGSNSSSSIKRAAVQETKGDATWAGAQETHRWAWRLSLRGAPGRRDMKLYTDTAV